MKKAEFFAEAEALAGMERDHPWPDRYPDYAVIRHPDSMKWFAAVIPVEPEKVGLSGTDMIDIALLKEEEAKIPELLASFPDVVRPAWHMQKKSWISVLLDETPERDSLIRELLQESFRLTASKPKKKKTPAKRGSWRDI